MGQLAQLGVALLRVVERLAEQRPRLLGLPAQRALRELERDDRVDQALLGAVVEVANDPPARLVARGQDAGARGGELIAAVGVGDRRVEQLRELRQALPPRRPGGGSCPSQLAVITPQSSPSTVIGAATVTLTCARRASSAIGAVALLVEVHPRRAAGPQDA